MPETTKEPISTGAAAILKFGILKFGILKFGMALLVVFVLSLSVLTLTAPDAFALRVTMKRVIFEGPRRTEILTIVNNSAEEQVYRLDWRHMRMTEDATLISVKEGDSMEGLRPVDEMIRYAPRRVVLAPGASQQVRLMLRRPKDLPDGEYRSHFWIQPEAEAVKFDPIEQKEGAPNIQIKMLTGMTLPVFVRSGNMTARASMEGAHIGPVKEGKQPVSFVINREGNRSLYGDLKFYCEGREPDPYHEVRGIAVYSEVTRRNMSFDVPVLEGQPPCGKFRIDYIAPEDDEIFKGEVMATVTTG